MPITPGKFIWMDGALVSWDEAKVHVLTHTLHYGSGVFEGIRAYETKRGPAVFRLTDHIERLYQSSHIHMIDVPFRPQELVDAVNAIVDDARLEGRLRDLRIDEADIASHLYTAGLPDPDLLIRTSGEMRVSNFLLWQIAYAELYVTDTLWPDFRRVDLLHAILDYQKRDRRFGGLSLDGERVHDEWVEVTGTIAR